MAIKSSELHKVWDALDNSRLTAKQQSFRFPVHVAAKVNALCDLFPNKSRTEIVGDLLTSALEELGNGLPHIEGQQVGIDEDRNPIYEDVGLHARYRDLANQHHRALEAELGNENPGQLFTGYGSVIGEHR